MSARALWRVVAGSLALAATGCGRDAPTLPPAEELLPPHVIEVHPAVRAERVPHDVSELWVSFAEALDSTTVTRSNVFLKLDTRRTSIAVRWDAATRRIVIRPLVTLQLAETYTVELQPGIRTAAGVPFGQVYWWQFTVTGVRPLRTPFPADAATASPYTPLTWDRTDASAGNVSYDLYASTDSAAVASRAVAPVTTSVAEHIPTLSTWGHARRVYWSVVARNLTLNQEAQGPVWRFDTMPAGAPMDSVVMTASFYAYHDSRFNRTACTEDRVIIGSLYQAVTRWNIASQQPGRSVAFARVTTSMLAGNAPAFTNIHSTRQAVPTNCVLSGGGTPLALSNLSGNVNVTPGLLYLASDALTAHVAAMHHELSSAHGFTFSSSSQGAQYSVPRLVIYFYR